MLARPTSQSKSWWPNYRYHHLVWYSTYFAAKYSFPPLSYKSRIKSYHFLYSYWFISFYMCTWVIDVKQLTFEIPLKASISSYIIHYCPFNVKNYPKFRSLHPKSIADLVESLCMRLTNIWINLQHYYTSNKPNWNNFMLYQLDEICFNKASADSLAKNFCLNLT